jgi:hypothetical protein
VISHFAELMVDASVLARLAEGAEVELRVARSALKKLAFFSDGELKFVARFAHLSSVQMQVLLDAAVPAEAIPLRKTR